MIERIKSPDDLKELSITELYELAEEIRTMMVERVASNGGHLASNLGIVELTIALHRSFNSPHDKFIFDVSHQVYVHKILTGRADKFATLRTMGGITGFMEPAESPHDTLAMGHAGCAPTLSLGLAMGDKLMNKSGYTVCVVGDGALTSGLAYEGLSNIIAQNPSNLMVILNDNGMSISQNVGWMNQWRNKWFTQLRNQLEVDRDFHEFEKVSERLAPKIPGGPWALSLGKGIKKTIDRAMMPEIGQVWEQMGFEYLGPVDGHNIKEITEFIATARVNTGKVPFLHVITSKGRGYAAAEEDPAKFHQPSTPSNSPTYSRVFCDALMELMENDSRIVAISAAMLDGTGLSSVKKKFPDRVFDVGICEQAAVSIAAGMARSGLRPVVSIYSTFLQRAYDQIMHDVCLNDLPVIFAIDRAGIAGEDGRTHQGLYDLSYMRIIPNMILTVPKDKNEMRHLLCTAVNQNHPFAIRFPRGSGSVDVKYNQMETIPIGSYEVVHSSGGSNIADIDLCIVAVGELVYMAMDAVFDIERLRVKPTVINMRFVKPVTPDFAKVLHTFSDIIVLEEGSSCGGATAAILEQMSVYKNGNPLPRVHQLAAGDVFLEHGTISQLRSKLGLTVEGIVGKVKSIIGGE